MIRIGVRELRQNASRYLRLVADGETVEVTNHGKLVALLTPPSPPSTARERLAAAGRLRLASAEFTLPQRVTLPAGRSTSLALDETREDRLA
ncbi:MAG: type II toxin-antitoxin system Phd/YefM family antitoxin [Chloroflexota bacterium]